MKGKHLKKQKRNSLKTPKRLSSKAPRVSSRKKKTRDKVRKDMTFAEIINADRKAAMKLASRGMFCGGCPMAQMETLEQGARAHGIDVDELVRELNRK